jgi:hypothetical protein
LELASPSYLSLMHMQAHQQVNIDGQELILPTQCTSRLIALDAVFEGSRVVARIVALLLFFVFASAALTPTVAQFAQSEGV